MPTMSINGCGEDMVCMFMKLLGSNIIICISVYSKLIENSATGRIQASYFLECMVQDTQTESRISCILPDRCKIASSVPYTRRCTLKTF